MTIPTPLQKNTKLDASDRASILANYIIRQDITIDIAYDSGDQYGLYLDIAEKYEHAMMYSLPNVIFDYTLEKEYGLSDKDCKLLEGRLYKIVRKKFSIDYLLESVEEEFYILLFAATFHCIKTGASLKDLASD